MLVVGCRVRVAEPAFAVGLGPDRDAVGALRLAIRRLIDEADHERRARRGFDHAIRDAAEALAHAVDAEAAHDDQMRADLGGEVGDLLGGRTGTHVQPDVPLGAVDPFETFKDERGESALDVVDIGVRVGHRHEVQIGLVVTRGLIDRVLEDDLRIFGEIEGDDDSRTVEHTPKGCIARAYGCSAGAR